MTQEEKDLLLKDLCGRLPYGVKVKIISSDSKNRIVYLTEDNICHLTNDWWGECKPYLFPLSSMTEEQKDVYHSFYADILRCLITPANSVKMIDWLHKNHFDYRNLIGLDLAINATGLNIY